MKRFFNFLQYHNGTVLLGMLIIGFAGSAFAATEITRQLDTYDAQVLDVQSPVMMVDKSALLDVDLSAFDTNLRIISAVEGDTAYTVTYRFNTFSIIEGVWQEIEKMNTLQIEKAALVGMDINAYAYTQLSEVLTKERAYLTEIQTNERANVEKSSKLKSFTNLSLETLAERAHTEREIVEQEPAPEKDEEAPVAQDEVENATTTDTDTDTDMVENENTIPTDTETDAVVTVNTETEIPVEVPFELEDIESIQEEDANEDTGDTTAL